MKTLTINRKKWLRGLDEGALLADEGFGKHEGKMCCLGFACLRLGVPREALLGQTMPYELKSFKLPKWLTTEAGDGVLGTRLNDVVILNDNPKISNKEREKGVRQFFKANGVSVRFV